MNSRAQLSQQVLGGALVTVFLTACSAGSAQSEPPAKPVSSATGTALPTPTAASGLAILDQWPASSGTGSAGAFFVHRGELWIDFSCIGAGTAVVAYRPVGTIDIPCSSEAANTARNQVAIPGDQEISLHVSAPASVRWVMLVQQ